MSCDHKFTRLPHNLLSLVSIWSKLLSCDDKFTRLPHKLLSRVSIWSKLLSCDDKFTRLPHNLLSLVSIWSKLLSCDDKFTRLPWYIWHISFTFLELLLEPILQDSLIQTSQLPMKLLYFEVGLKDLALGKWYRTWRCNRNFKSKIKKLSEASNQLGLKFVTSSASCYLRLYPKMEIFLTISSNSYPSKLSVLTSLLIIIFYRNNLNWPR